jgi:hypothetical protein
MGFEGSKSQNRPPGAPTVRRPSKTHYQHLLRLTVTVARLQRTQSKKPLFLLAWQVMPFCAAM